MPAGGTWTVQNKQRPGAYINFKSVPKAIGAIGTRGIMTAALPMTWGPNGVLIELYGTDLLDGSSLAKIGCTAADNVESLSYRLALSGCYKALLFRADTGGVKASAVINANLTAIAKHAGTTGNKLEVAIIAGRPQVGQYEVNVYFNSILKETFNVIIMGDFKSIESEWINFTVAVGQEAAVITATSGAPLLAGTNGLVVSATYTDYFNLVTTAQWQCMAIQTVDALIPPLVIAKIKSLRNDLGKKVQAVVYNDVSADFEGIISVKQGFKTLNDIVTLELFPLWVASMTAGSNINQSRTAYEVPSATEIIGYIAENLISDQLKLGWFLLSYRQDGAVVVEQDINCLHTFTVDKNYAFCKNRVIRCLDEIGNTTALVFNRNYAGKVDNNNIGRSVYKSELITFIDSLVTIGAVQNFDGAADIIVLPGATVEGVVVDLVIQPVDSMEKLYMTVNVDA